MTRLLQIGILHFMFSLLTRIFIKNYTDVKNPDVRRQYGALSGVFGIFLNLLLFGIKLTAGFISRSIAITADAMNNLSDAGASIITVLGFKLAGKKPDKNHPFGHGRFEYVTGLFVSFLILMMGFELLKSSVAAVLHPEPVSGTMISVVILVISICVKAYMYFFNHAVSKKINSASMEATAKDSLSDTVSTSVVLVSTVLYMFHVTELPVDGIAGLVVSVFILKNGYDSVRDTIQPLLGQPPEKEFVEEIDRVVMAHKMVSGIHDLIVHDYGPGRVMVSLHAEVDGTENIFAVHDEIDNIETELNEKFNCSATIHMDPVDVNSSELKELKEIVKSCATEIAPELSVHDLRIVPGTTHTNIVFDLVKPHECDIPDAKLSETLSEKVRACKPNCCCVIKVEPSFV